MAIQNARLATQYYEGIAARYHFFKRNGQQIDYYTARDWAKMDSDDRRCMIKLGRGKWISSSAFHKLPQEVLDKIRFEVSGSAVLSRHSFEHLEIQEQSYKK